MRYPADQLTAADADLLRPHVSTLDGPVFALTNLPEAVKAALFARYSRYQGTLRRLMLDEFSDTLADSLHNHASAYARRVEQLSVDANLEISAALMHAGLADEVAGARARW